MIRFARDIPAPTRQRARQRGIGREADRPREIPPPGWRDILWRLFGRLREDRVDIVSAGASFYLLLSLFPALAAFVSLFGFVARAEPLVENVSRLEAILPAAAIDLIERQMAAIVGQRRNVLSFGFVGGLAVALWLANRGMKSLFAAMNVAFDEKEKRGFIHLNLVAFAFTLGAMVIATAFIAGVGLVPAVLAVVGLAGWAEWLIGVGRWPVLFLAALTGILLLYRYGPSRRPPRLKWILWGAVLATALWIAASVGVSWYLQNWANYNATYGSLGAAAAFMTWAWLSVFILIACAELSAEMEHQTAQDSTVGRERPLGERGAVMADTLGESASAAKSARKQDEKTSPFAKGKARAEHEGR